MWRIVRLRAKIKVQTFLMLFKRENKMSNDVEKEFMRLFSDIDNMMSNMFGDIDGFEFNPGSA